MFIFGNYIIAQNQNLQWSSPFLACSNVIILLQSFPQSLTCKVSSSLAVTVSAEWLSGIFNMWSLLPILQGHQGSGKDNLIQGTQKGRIFRKRFQVKLEGINARRDWCAIQQLVWGRRGHPAASSGKPVGWRSCKWTVGSAVSIQDMNVRTLWKGQPLSKTKEAINSRSRAMDVEALPILGTSATTNQKSRMMVIHLDWLEPYQGAT